MTCTSSRRHPPDSVAATAEASDGRAGAAAARHRCSGRLISASAARIGRTFLTQPNAEVRHDYRKQRTRVRDTVGPHRFLFHEARTDVAAWKRRACPERARHDVVYASDATD